MYSRRVKSDGATLCDTSGGVVVVLYRGLR
jgi:hypothetical protein